ncbi:hypothetical protein N0M98_31405 [Paenibacillus doosanensis]|nr:hypothetical protein [Paenibacillus doosanensis]
MKPARTNQALKMRYFCAASKDLSFAWLPAEGRADRGQRGRAAVFPVSLQAGPTPGCPNKDAKRINAVC